jgi:hypothetical protein
MKGDLLDVYIDYVNGEMAHGKVGAAEVMIPRQKMEGLEYVNKENVYSCELSNGERVSVGNGACVRCRCIEWFAENGKNWIM